MSWAGLMYCLYGDFSTGYPHDYPAKATTRDRNRLDAIVRLAVCGP
jgi:hypothetical protein